MIGPQTEAALPRINSSGGSLCPDNSMTPPTRCCWQLISGLRRCRQPKYRSPPRRPERQRFAHDRAEVFQATQAPPSSSAFADQPDEGKVLGDVLTPVQLDGLTMSLTPFPPEEFNSTYDRKSADASLGVTCLDCHVNGHATGQFHLNPDNRPQERRFRLDTVSLRGLFNQQIHGSKRSLRSVEDFTDFEFRTGYFNGDPIMP